MTVSHGRIQKTDPEKNQRTYFLSSHPTILSAPFQTLTICASTQRTQSESLNLLQNRYILIKWHFLSLEVDGLSFPLEQPEKNYTFSKAVWYTVLILEFMFFLDYKIKVALLYSVHVSCI